MSAFGTFLIGILLLVVGLGIGAYMLDAPPVWIGIGAFIVLGIGVMAATMRTKMKDPPAA